jgi:hypothetical protein
MRKVGAYTQVGAYGSLKKLASWAYIQTKPLFTSQNAYGRDPLEKLSLFSNMLLQA